MARIKLGFALCGSFCTFAPNFALMERLAADYDIQPIFSFHAASLDTRFGRAADFVARAEAICGKPCIRTIEDAEPIGPAHKTELMLVSPCTGNTLAKLAYSIVDTPVTMAVKSHLRNGNPVVIALSTNDAMSGCFKNIGMLANYRNFFFVPFGQDNHRKKPASLVARFELAPETLAAARMGVQIEPLTLAPYES